MICLYKNIAKTSNELDVMKNNLFLEFEKPINVNSIDNIKKSKNSSITNRINNSIDEVINEIVLDLINTNSFLLCSKNIPEMVKSCKKFFQDTQFGTFEYVQKTGMSIFKVEHTAGINGTLFLKKFFEKIFEVVLKGFSFYVISNENYVCVMFR
ncbi:conserved hypothetical protein [metagenome]